MKKSMLGWFGLARYQWGLLRDGSDEKTWFRTYFGVSDVWTGMFMIVFAYNGSMLHLLPGLGLVFWLRLYSKD